ncbi:helix-turn-helix domain-containing protein, partial [Plesiomonas shigelloides]
MFSTAFLKHIVIEKKMIELFQWIDKHLDDNLTTEIIVHKSGYSKRQLHNIFVKYTKCGIAEYVRKKRLHYASTLLKTSKISVRDIAEKFHFDSAQSFSRAFKKHYGLTPTEYRTSSVWGRLNNEDDPLSIESSSIQTQLVYLDQISIIGKLETCKMDVRERKTYWNTSFSKFKYCIENALSRSSTGKLLIAIKYSP